VLGPKLRVELGERLVLVPPERHLALQLPDQLVLGGHLAAHHGVHPIQLALEGFDSLSRPPHLCLLLYTHTKTKDK